MPVTPQTNVSLTEISAVLKSRDDYVICGHVSPDGDCLGSQLALAGILRRLGKRVTCVLAKPEKPDVRLSFLPGLADMVYARDFMGEVGTFVAVDVPNRERIGDASRLLDEAEYSITIDRSCVSRDNEHPYVLQSIDGGNIDAGLGTLEVPAR